MKTCWNFKLERLDYDKFSRLTKYCEMLRLSSPLLRLFVLIPSSLFQVPVGRSEAPSWARFSSPSDTDYSVPGPMKKSPWYSHHSQTATNSPLVPRPGRGHAASLGSLHSSLVYDRNTTNTFFSHFSPGRNKTTSRHRPLYENVAPPPPPNCTDYEYSTTAYGEASPYSVSSELYKHVLPQYFQFNRRPTSRGSVLV